jgi:aminopeptidase N
MKSSPVFSLFLAFINFLMLSANDLPPANSQKTIPKYNWYLDYDIKFYQIDLRVNDKDPYVAGNVSIKSEVSILRLDTFRFELNPKLTIDSVFAGKIKIVASRKEDVVSVPLPHPYHQKQSIIITVHYKGMSASEGFFSPLTTRQDTRWKIPVTWTLSEPLGAKQWLPSKQYLPDKIDSAWIFITVPKKCKAGSNGILTGVTPIGKKEVRYEWKTKYPIAYYLLFFAVSEYKEYRFYAKINHKDSVLVQNFIYNRPQCLETNKELIDQTGEYLKFFSSLYGDYPFLKEKYGHCMAPMGGGMEHQTMTTLSSFNSTLVIHELAHQWFGDLVTCSNWQDIWVSEGFASYSEYLALDKLKSHDEAFSWMNSAHQNSLREMDGSVFVPWEERENDNRIFSYALSYKKGASILHMLRYELNNDSLFFNILREYLHIYKGVTTTSEDFKNVLNRLTANDYTWFFNEWYYGKGFPIYDISWKTQKDTLSITSLQIPSAKDGPIFKMHFDLQLTYSGGDTIVKLYQDKPKKSFKIPCSKKVQQLTFDPHEWLLKEATVNKIGD